MPLMSTQSYPLATLWLCLVHDETNANLLLHLLIGLKTRLLKDRRQGKDSDRRSKVFRCHARMTRYVCTFLTPLLLTDSPLSTSEYFHSLILSPRTWICSPFPVKMTPRQSISIESFTHATPWSTPMAFHAMNFSSTYLSSIKLRKVLVRILYMNDIDFLSIKSRSPRSS